MLEEENLLLMMSCLDFIDVNVFEFFQTLEFNQRFKF